MTVPAETFLIPLADGQSIVYAPLAKTAFVANERLVDFIADLDAGRRDSISDPDGALVEILRQIGFLEGGTEPRPVTSFSGQPRPTAVTLFLTTGCNLRCRYCYASAGDTPRERMPLEVARRGIDFVASNAARQGSSSFDLNFHGGGEPTTNWRTLTGATDYARRRAEALGLALWSSTATNGVLSDDKIDWIIRNLTGASVSVDGLPSIQNRNRPSASGGESSTRVLRTIRRFDEAGFPYGIRVTVTADDIASLPASIAYLCEVSRAHRIQVEPAYALGRWKDAPSAETTAFIDAFRSARSIAGDNGRELLFSGARVGLLTNHFCGVSQDGFGLSPSGRVSGCYEAFSERNEAAKTFFYGKPAAQGAGYEFDLDVLDRLRAQSVENREFCRGCFAKWHCAGDCYHKFVATNGEVEFSGSERCHVIRELTKDQILEKIVSSGGVVWREG